MLIVLITFIILLNCNKKIWSFLALRLTLGAQVMQKRDNTKPLKLNFTFFFCIGAASCYLYEDSKHVENFLLFFGGDWHLSFENRGHTIGWETAFSIFQPR